MRQHQPSLSGKLGAAAFVSELERSRRYGREFCLVKVEHAGGASAADVAAWLGSVVRRIDVVWTEGSACLVLLPEAGREAGQRLVDRLNTPESEAIEASSAVSYSVAAFPADAVTSVALLEMLDLPENRVHPELGAVQPGRDVTPATPARHRRRRAAGAQRPTHAVSGAENSAAHAG